MLTQLEPLSIEYSYDVIAWPPFDAGAVYSRVASLPTTSICVITGALGTVYGFETTGSDEVPEPFAFTARMRTV